MLTVCVCVLHPKPLLSNSWEKYLDFVKIIMNTVRTGARYQECNILIYFYMDEIEQAVDFVL